MGAQGHEGCRGGGTSHEAQGHESNRGGGTGHEGDESNEGNEGHEESHESNEGHEGHEGNEEVNLCGGWKCVLSVLAGNGHMRCVVALSRGGVPRLARLYNQ